jgi:putative pyruvate formate lyase activating enzyme
MYPSYLQLSANGELAKRAGLGYAAMKNCKLCPRNCEVNRLEGEKGFCRTGKIAKVASHNLHHGEEPPISGHRGSGTIFFSHCNLRCIFCQNYPISQFGTGEPVNPERLATMMLNLQKRGAHNINLVTPSHVVPQFLAGLTIAADEGLELPIVYNSSGYDGLEALKLLDGVVDIYMPDLKYVTDEPAERYSSATKYWDSAKAAVKEMYAQVGSLEMDEDGVGIRGLLIRHLVLPGGLAGSEKVFEFIATELSPEVPVNLMSQYFPAYKAVDDPLLGRRITREEFAEAEKSLHKWKLDNGWIQRM